MNLKKPNLSKGIDQRKLTKFLLFQMLPAAESMQMSHVPSLSIWLVERDTAVHPPWFAPSSEPDCKTGRKEFFQIDCEVMFLSSKEEFIANISMPVEERQKHVRGNIDIEIIY